MNFNLPQVAPQALTIFSAGGSLSEAIVHLPVEKIVTAAEGTISPDDDASDPNPHESAGMFAKGSIELVFVLILIVLLIKTKRNPGPY